MRTAVTIVAFENSVEMSITVLRDMFAAAHAASTLKMSADPVPFVVATEDGESVCTFSGATLSPQCAISEIEYSDLIIISGVWSNEEPFVAGNEKVGAWLLTQYDAGSIIACMHTGAFLLAETGLLDDKHAAVYWKLEEKFRRRFPKVILRTDRKTTSADRLFCSSGIGSGLEMGIYLIEQLYGAVIAEKVAQNFLMDLAPNTQGLRTTFAQFKQHGDEKILAAQQWMEWHYASEFLLEEVADRTGLGVRTFTRRFHKATGESALHYLQRLRIEHAKALLKKDALPIDQVAFRVGYKDPTHFGRIFRRLVESTPSEFRRNCGVHRGQS